MVKAKYTVIISEIEEKQVNLQSFLSRGQLLAKNIGAFEPSGFTVESSMKSTKMQIIPTFPEGHGPEDIYFVPFTANFKTKKKPQLLKIDTSDLRKINGLSIVGIKTEKEHLVHIDRAHIDDGAGGFPEVEFNTLISSALVDTIYILFKMPDNKKTDVFHFELTIQAKGATKTTTFDCDPQVGNDPPLP
jgi:hypothetical protein